MAYIGKSPVIGNFVKLDAISVVNGQAAYTMQNGGSNFTDYESVNQFLVSLNGTIQAPTDSFTVSGSTLTFASNLSTGDVIDFIMVFGNSLSAGTPTDATVTTAKLADSAVTAAKITDSTITAAKLASGTVQNQSAFKNIIINGDMSIAQRGTSTSSVTTTDGYYACDRWYSQTDTGTWTISQSTDVPTGQGFVNSFKMDCTSAGTSNADEVMIRSKHEGQNLQYLKYGTSSAEGLILTFWIKSNKTGNYYVAFVNNNSTQDRVVSFGYSIDSADTWEKKTITIPGDTSRSIENTVNEEFTIYWLFSAASAFTSGGVSNTWIDYSASRFANSDLAGLGGSTSDEVYMTGVQLEAGTSASDFEFLPYSVNEIRCLRYYQILDVGSNCPLYTTGDGNHNRHLRLTWGVRKRAAPSCSSSATSGTLSSLGETHDSKSFFVNVGSGSGTTGLNANVTIDAEL